ncbi:MAG: XRE family transcriptional regulator [Legionellales bacterium]|nr:XRE family transcriptional regulator [Legionellales bacterium]
MKKQNLHIGSSFDDFLEEEGELAAAQVLAIKRVISHLLKENMEEKKVTKTALAKALHTSRSELDRLLDPENTSITLHSIAKVAKYTGKNIYIKIDNL